MLRAVKLKHAASPGRWDQWDISPFPQQHCLEFSLRPGRIYALYADCLPHHKISLLWTAITPFVLTHVALSTNTYLHQQAPAFLLIWAVSIMALNSVHSMSLQVSRTVSHRICLNEPAVTHAPHSTEPTLARHQTTLAVNCTN